MTTTCTEPTIDLILGEESHLRGVARRLVRCDSDADDLVQETLLRAYHARDRFRPGTSARAWTTTILRRLFLTGAIRDRRRGLQNDTDAGGALETAVGRTAPPYQDPPSDPHSVCDPAVGDQFEDAVKRALERVPEIYRTSFLLSVVRGLSCEEIGALLGAPASTVMSRIHRARERLRCDLAPYRNDLRGPVRRATSSHEAVAASPTLELCSQ